MTHLVTKQSVVYNFNVKQCLTRDNVPVSIRATAVLRVCGEEARGEDPALVRKFVHEMGVQGLEAQLVNAVVRKYSRLFCLCDGQLSMYSSPYRLELTN